MGGIGLRSATDMALPQFIASVNSTHDIANLLCDGENDLEYELARTAWEGLTYSEPPTDSAISARTWDAPISAAKRDKVRGSLLSQLEMARFVAASTSESALLFQGLPSDGEGTRLPDSTFTIAVSLRLALPVAACSSCSCGLMLDAYGDHALVCKKLIGKSARHTEVNARIHQVHQQAGCPSILEPPGMTRVDGKRPDGATILLYERGLPMAWDATIVHTSAQSYRHLTSAHAGEAAAAAVAKMRVKYAALDGRVDFRSVGLETLGPFGPSASELLDSIATRIRAQTGDAGARTRLYRRIAAALQMGNAVSLD